MFTAFLQFYKHDFEHMVCPIHLLMQHYHTCPENTYINTSSVLGIYLLPKDTPLSVHMGVRLSCIHIHSKWYSQQSVTTTLHSQQWLQLPHRKKCSDCLTVKNSENCELKNTINITYLEKRHFLLLDGSMLVSVLSQLWSVWRHFLTSQSQARRLHVWNLSGVLGCHSNRFSLQANIRCYNLIMLSLLKQYAWRTLMQCHLMQMYVF